MRQHFLGVAFSCSLLVGAAAFAAVPLQNVPLTWKPTSSFSEMGPLDLGGVALTTKVHFGPLVDTRENPTLVAENHEKADKVRSMTTSSDVGAFVADHLKETAHGAGLNVVDGDADLIVSGEIRKFFVTEIDNYNGEISLFVHIKDRSGKELWTGLVSGGASGFGRSYKAENYYEVMSNMVLRVTYNLLASEGFRSALAKH